MLFLAHFGPRNFCFEQFLDIYGFAMTCLGLVSVTCLLTCAENLVMEAEQSYLIMCLETEQSYFVMCWDGTHEL